MKVTIRIFGSAICYLKDDLWHIIFITDDTHLVKFSHDGTVSQIPLLRESGLDRNVTFFADNPTPSTPEYGENYREILNMATDMHGDGKLKVKRTFNPKREIICMMIPAGMLSRDTMTDLNYYIEQTHPIPAPTRPLGRPVAKSVKIEMDLNEGRGLTMLIQDGKGTKTLHFPVTDHPLNLTFDNDCGASCKEVNDFELYYDWLEDTDGLTKFIAGKDSKIKSEQGNCDPVNVQPPPG
jgi:hypothetical protein